VGEKSKSPAFSLNCTRGFPLRSDTLSTAALIAAVGTSPGVRKSATDRMKKLKGRPLQQTHARTEKFARDQSEAEKLATARMPSRTWPPRIRRRLLCKKTRHFCDETL